MERRTRLVGFVAGYLALVLGFTALYWWGMAAFEEEPVSVVAAFQFVVETFTTIGYGSGAPWSSAAMNLIVSGMAVTGVLLLFTTIPLFVAPWLQGVLATTVPTEVRGDLADHVVVCNYTSRGETILDEFESRDVDYVVVEADEEQAERLHVDGFSVIHGDPERTEALRKARVTDAEAVIVDASDEANASTILSVRSEAPAVRVVSLVANPELTEYLRYAGADTVLLPRHLLGRSIADQASTSVRAQLGETVEIGEHFAVAELPLHNDSPLCGERLFDAGIRERTGANVIGIWANGEFQASPSTDHEIGERDVLLAAGTDAQLTALRELTQSEARQYGTKTAVIAGCGEVGSTVAEGLEQRGMRTVVVDVDDDDDVDLVGDATDADVLREAGIDDASVFIVALADDTDGIFATLVARELNESLEIFARANESENTAKMRRAGADYVLGLPNVSGRMLALDVLGEEVMAVSRQIKMVRTAARGLEGRSLGTADVRAETGCTVVAVERGDEVLTELGPEFVVEEGDRVILAGDDEDISAFEGRYVD